MLVLPIVIPLATAVLGLLAQRHRELQRTISLLGCGALTVLIGLKPKPVYRLAERAATELLDRQGYITAVLASRQAAHAGTPLTASRLGGAVTQAAAFPAAVPPVGGPTPRDAKAPGHGGQP